MTKNRDRSTWKYYRRVRELLDILSPGNQSILDVGGGENSVAGSGDFKTRARLDIRELEPIPGVRNITGDFLEVELEPAFDVVTCLQVIEHLEDHELTRFARRLRACARWLIVSIPFYWPKGDEPTHRQDPMGYADLMVYFPLTQWVYSEVIHDNQPRLILVMRPEFNLPPHPWGGLPAGMPEFRLWPGIGS